jgi:lysine-specific demethylase 8
MTSHCDERTDSAAVERVSGLSRDRFVRDYVSRRRPALISGATDAWPAMTKWDFSYFESLGAQTEVELEVGDCLTQATVREKRGFSDYVSAISKEAQCPRGKDAPAYLSVYPIFDEFPALRADVRFDLWPNRHHFYVAWIGSKGTFSGLHLDRSHGCLAQIRGRKRVVLYEPSEWAWMYESLKYDCGTAISQVDVRNPDYTRFPLFRKARGIEVLLEPGQILYTPLGWPHYVISLEPSISLTCFGHTYRDLVVHEIWTSLLGNLHNLGLYRRGNCTCHAPVAAGSRRY